MALIFRKGHEDLPEDAVRMTEKEALAYQMTIIEKWPKYSEVFAFKSSAGILGALSMGSSFLINNHFRNKLKLGKYGRVSSYLTVVATPVMISTLFHKMFVQSYIVLRAYDCPLCLQTRAGLFQGGFGVVYPFLLAPVAAFMYATRHFTYRLPSITTQPKDVFKLWFKFTKSATTMGGILLAVNLVAGMAIAAREMQEHTNINLALAEYEKKFESGSLDESELH